MRRRVRRAGEGLPLARAARRSTPAPLRRSAPPGGAAAPGSMPQARSPARVRAPRHSAVGPDRHGRAAPLPNQPRRARTQRGARAGDTARTTRRRRRNRGSRELRARARAARRVKAPEAVAVRRAVAPRPPRRLASRLAWHNRRERLRRMPRRASSRSSPLRPDLRSFRPFRVRDVTPDKRGLIALRHLLRTLLAQRSLRSERQLRLVPGTVVKLP